MSEISFNEKDYLAANPDVADAVASGQFKSGAAHYGSFGKKENRMLNIFSGMSRVDKAMSQLDKRGLGLEIGPSHNPVAPKSKGFNVHILDHLDTNALRNKYKDHGVKIENIEEVDFVWRGEPLHELIGQQSHYDWIIASHVIEHVPDLVSFFQQCETLLKPNGKLSLIIPDKRYCFDYLNPLSKTGDLLDSFQEKRTRPSVGKVFDHISNACKRNGNIAWAADATGDLSLVHSIEQAQTLWKQASISEDYIDVHCWRFTPESFYLILSDLNILKLTYLGIVKEFKTTGCEFYVTLGKHVDFIKNDRLQMLQQSKASDGAA